MTEQNDELAEEIEAINAIYEPETVSISTSSRSATSSTLDLAAASPAAQQITTVTLHIPEHPNLSFLIGFDARYPDTPPRVVGTASTASRGQGKIAVEALEEIVARVHQPGAVCLFEVINEAVEAFHQLELDKREENQNDHHHGDFPATSDEPLTADFAALSLREAFGLDHPPEWILSEVVTEKKSIFVGRAAHVTSVEQARGFIDHLLATEKKVAAATHNISAWRIRQQSATNGERVFQDCDDDGETAAGGRLLHLMQLMDVWDVVVVVTRWYGGVLLGPDRFRIINAVGRDALARGGFAREEATSTEKGKKKGKK
ncbi:hypothetical protein ASPZODRAFT_129298 [Penicilliopsis zonata CBS 506.65]|uniref:RWD domain-containing protein n=1 Tax=Penicilliopsis zonata CBS 506.65 TaxID=1073090 RepID=A0A1L9SPA7_9EURO|nr:hypothetical protein ASPZODRAFT_129298 [Penicilliopsis zonata CBS 506.65]OJJ48956.1 hypothetical protein ASPZODRAFT_129298 [Penicilliopsis zonata CBS 506.65]